MTAGPVVREIPDDHWTKYDSKLRLASLLFLASGEALLQVGTESNLQVGLTAYKSR